MNLIDSALYPQQAKQRFFEPATAWMAIAALIVITTAGIVAGAGSILRILFPALCFAIGVPEQKIRVILNGVDLQEFFPGEGDRSQWQLPEQITMALFAGDIRSNRKNLATVLQALVHISTLHLVVAGEIEGSPYPELVATLGLNQRVHFLGHRHDLHDLMRATDFFVFPSRYEPFGMIVIEAMASGLPVIVANTAGVAEVITPECGIVLANAEDKEGLLQALRTFADDEELRSRMGHASLQVAKQHCWSSKAKSYVTIFEETVKT